MKSTAKQKKELNIRRASASDAAALAKLSGELGYPATEVEIKKRLGRLKPAAQHAVFVAEASAVIGWLHVSVSHLIEEETRAEVNALVVANGERSAGAGRQLLAAAEAWARKLGCAGMSVRSNAIREQAHRFYEREGYEHYKTQKAFRKRL